MSNRKNGKSSVHGKKKPGVACRQKDISEKFLEDEQIERFTSDFKIVADFFVKKRKYRDDFKPIDMKITHVDAILKLLSVMTNDDRYADPQLIKKVREERKMCTVLDFRENRGIAKGRLEGRLEGRSAIITLLAKQGMDKEKILKEITAFPAYSDVTMEDIDSILR